MIVQIYEIQTPAEAEACIEAGVGHIGSVILSGDEWRVPDIRDVVRLSEGTGVRNSLIPLFHDSDTLYRALDYYRPRYVHLCDSLTDGQGRPVDPAPFVRMQEELKKRFPEVGIIRSIPVPGEREMPQFPALRIARDLEPVTDIFLTDTWQENAPVAGYIGITGRTCDREIARDLVLHSRIPVILAGGLSPENVYEALSAVAPAGADSCTGTNRRDPEGKPVRFRKDFGRVRAFVNETRRAEADFRTRFDSVARELAELREELQEREAALPAHSLRPAQLLAIEEVEEKIAGLEQEARRLEMCLSRGDPPDPGPV
ncbi:MAG: hypothetical protein DRH56_09250 [Deltaproteobacteria bacterium]|nr:MAG: hypothetical protein DRH56_09250 [Deltaproteobacteria bacterium]